MSAKSAVPDFHVFSDGGERSRRSAAAAIVEDPKNGTRRHLVAWLGTATNNESEIFGGLLGLSCAKFLAEGKPDASILWCADSEYVLKSATQYILNWQKNGWKTASKEPVKNQGLWKFYLSVRKGLVITPEHVYGHTGHRENEMCDAACNWAQQEGDSDFKGKSSSRTVLIGDEVPWLYIDGRAAIEMLREEGDADSITEIFQQWNEQGPGAKVAKKSPYTAILRKLNSLLEDVRAIDEADAKRAGIEKQLVKAIEIAEDE